MQADWNLTPEQQAAASAELLRLERVKKRDAAILAWQVKSTALAVAAREEKDARAEVIKLAFDTLKEGTNTVELGKGYKLSVKQPYYYKLDTAEENKATDEALTKLEEMGNEGAFIADRLVKWKPELSISEYRKLDDKYKAVIDKVLTISPGSAQVELVTPKDKA